MKQILIFMSGLFAGAILMFCMLFIKNMDSNESDELNREILRQELINELKNSFDQDVHKVQIQYVEVKGKKGIVTLYTGMPKDSVKILLGKPDGVELSSYGNISVEKWRYKVKDNFVPDLDIDFNDGKLNRVRQD
ncbi:MAG: hypothetical protein IT247_03990 [Bacteroidia bacterium]|nr:hypothetical protein [Bacteroidia bacterium]